MIMLAIKKLGTRMVFNSNIKAAILFVRLPHAMVALDPVIAYICISMCPAVGCVNVLEFLPASLYLLRGYLEFWGKNLKNDVTREFPWANLNNPTLLDLQTHSRPTMQTGHMETAQYIRLI